MTPAMSSGSPRRFRGLSSRSCWSPPSNSINPFASLEGKNPGATVLQVMFLGPSSMARFLERWCAAALDTEYIIVPLSPMCGTLIPAVELTMITREGSSRVPPAVRRGTALSKLSARKLQRDQIQTHNRTRLNIPRTFKSRTFWDDQSGVGSNGPPQVAPALATRISILSSVFLISLSSLSMSSV
jgi:hypothetical protein